MTKSDALKAFEERLGYSFQDSQLLMSALTHRSYLHEHPEDRSRDNERLEFLGDAIIGSIIAGLLWNAFPEAHEGELTRRRAELVCEASLSKVAAEIGIGEALRLGRGEEKQGGRQKPRLIASAFEACMGAVYLDGGYPAAAELGEKLFTHLLLTTEPGMGDYKSRLQELAQARWGVTPLYSLMRTEGPDHRKLFFVRVTVTDAVIGEGAGNSKSEAEQHAALDALQKLNEVTPA